MYSLAISHDFIAQHYLIGGDWGAENQLHSHPYRLELLLEAAELDEHGYLVDILEVETILNALLERYRDHVLNDLPEFSALNPSVEHFARILCQAISARLSASNISAMTVRVYEHANAWAAFRQERQVS